VSPSVWIRRLPWSIVVIAAVLIVLGWLAIARAEQLSGGSGNSLRRQMLFSVVAAAAMLAASTVNYRILCRYSYAIFLLALALLLVVYFFPAINNAHRWIRLGPVSLQPSEFAKVAFVLALARYLMYRENYRRLRGLLVPLAITTLPVLLILREPDLGTAAVFLPVLFLMLFVAGAKRSDLAILVVIALLLLPMFWTQMSREQRSRITSLVRQPAPGQRVGDDDSHLYRAKRVRALGGVWGSFLTGEQSKDRAVYHVPEGRSDFIFCILGERFGLPGMAVVLGLFGLLAWRGVAVAAATREPFGRLLAAGIVALIAVEVLINTGMTVGLLPITGLSLPLVSHGGSGLVANAVALGLLLNVGLRPGYEVTNEPFRWVVGSG